MKTIFELESDDLEELKAAPKYIVNGKDMRAKVLIGSRYLYPTAYEKGKVLIAYRFSDERIVCPECALPYDLVEQGSCGVYAVNIIPYSQTCHICDKDIVMGWACQLYEKPLLSLSQESPFEALKELLQEIAKEVSISHLKSLLKAHEEQPDLYQFLKELISERGYDFQCKCGKSQKVIHNKGWYTVGCFVCGYSVSTQMKEELQEAWERYYT